MGESRPQPTFFYHISLEQYVPQEHPLRVIRPLIDDAVIRKACKPLYSKIGRPSIPPEQLFLAFNDVQGAAADRQGPRSDPPR
jgi:transposase